MRRRMGTGAPFLSPAPGGALYSPFRCSLLSQKPKVTVSFTPLHLSWHNVITRADAHELLRLLKSELSHLIADHNI